MTTLSILDHATIYRNPEPNRISDYVAFPSIQALPDGSLLCMCRHGSARESLDGRVRLHRSTDGGHNWEMLPDLPAPAGNLEGWWLPGGFGITRTGDVLAWIVQAGTEPRRHHLYRSSDSGNTWTAPTQIDLAPFSAMGPGGNLATLSDGTLIAGGESKGRGPGAEDAEWVSLITRSTDHGHSWEPVRIVHRSTRPHYFDVRFTALPDDRLLAAYWTQDMEANQGLNVHLAWSDDAGRTWSEPRDSGFWGQVTDVLALQSGRVLAVTNHRREPLGIRALLSEDAQRFEPKSAIELWGLEPPAIRSAPMLAANGDRSTDALQAYHHFTFGTPSATQREDGTIIVAFYVTEANVTYVRCCHLREDEVVTPRPRSKPSGQSLQSGIDWRGSLTDPVRDHLHTHDQAPDLETIRALFPAPQGDPAFDPALINGNIERLRTIPAIDTGEPFLDQSIRVGLASIDATFQGNHPKYGIKQYGENRGDGFPPTIIAAIDALTLWGLHDRAKQLFSYWLDTFVRRDGTIAYYGPALSEYGQLLHTARLLHERAGPNGWRAAGLPALQRLAGYVMQLCADAAWHDNLVAGIPEADISRADPNNVSDGGHSEDNRFFHNNAWLARGLRDWAALLENHTAEGAAHARQAADELARRTLNAIEQTWPEDPADWWLSPQLEPTIRPTSLTATIPASYTNYRYWPELLSSGLLPTAQAHRLVEARLNGGGQFCGMTRFRGHLDDWPLVDYLRGLWQLGRTDDFLLSLYGHIAFHQAAHHLTAYEQIALPPGHEIAAYCLPCQLVAARAGRVLNRRTRQSHTPHS